MRYLILGAGGMAGHIISIYLVEKGHEVYTFSRQSIKYGINIIGDVKDINGLKELITNYQFDCVVNTVGILNQKAEDSPSESVFINSYLPHYLAEVTKEMKTKVIHMSTDCVFSGNKGNYIETDLKDGLSMYDRSKALGEIDNPKDLTVRTSIIGPDLKIQGIGLFNWFMIQDGYIKGYKEVFWSGVTTLKLAQAIEKFSTRKLHGIIHLTNNQKISKFQLLTLFNSIFRKNTLKIEENLVKKTDKSLINTRHDIDFDIPGYETMLKDMKEWMVNHHDLYPHYEL